MRIAVAAVLLVGAWAVAEVEVNTGPEEVPQGEQPACRQARACGDCCRCCECAELCQVAEPVPVPLPLPLPPPEPEQTIVRVDCGKLVLIDESAAGRAPEAIQEPIVEIERRCPSDQCGSSQFLPTYQPTYQPSYPGYQPGYQPMPCWNRYRSCYCDMCNPRYCEYCNPFCCQRYEEPACCDCDEDSDSCLNLKFLKDRQCGCGF